MPVKLFSPKETGNGQWCVGDTLSDAKATAGRCHDTRDKAIKQLQAINANIDEMFVRDYWVSEFRGEFPDIPTAPDVNIAELTEGDDNPMFLNLPVAKRDAVSRKGLRYDDELINSLYKQIIETRPTGIRGHLSEIETQTKYPKPDVYWVGATIVDDTLWAKGYVPKGEVADDYRRLKAARAKAATSIFGPQPEKKIANDDGTYSMRGFELQSLDLAPYNRASLQLGGQFHLTREMYDKEDTVMDKDKVISEMTVDDVPENIRKAIEERYASQEKNKGLVSEMQAERDKAVSELTDANKELASYRSKERNNRLRGFISEMVKDWNVTGEDNIKKVNALLDTIFNRAVMEMGDNPNDDEIKTLVSEIWDSDNFQILAETLKQSLMGPPSPVKSKDNRQGNNASLSDDNISEILGRYGFGTYNFGS